MPNTSQMFELIVEVGTAVGAVVATMIVVMLCALLSEVVFPTAKPHEGQPFKNPNHEEVR